MIENPKHINKQKWQMSMTSGLEKHFIPMCVTRSTLGIKGRKHALDSLVIVSNGMYKLVRTHKNLTYIYQYVYIEMHMSYT